MRTFVAALFLLLFPAAPSFAESSAVWLQVKSDHFTVITDGSERQARHTAGQLERMHDVFAKLLPRATDDPGSRIVVLALRDRKSFRTVEPAAYLAKDMLDLAGLFLRGDDRNYILLRLDSTGDHPYTTVYHEYTHYMVRHAEFLPVWLNEGLAQFYQNTDIYDHEVRLGQPDGNELGFLREQRLLPLETLFQVDHDSPYYHEENKGNIFYGESWALTHYLFMQDFNSKRARLHTYTEDLVQGKSPLAAAQHAFGDLKVLQNELADYINHGSYKSLTMPLQNAVDEKTLKVEPLPTPDADAMRADVLARDGRTREAEELALSTLASSPQNPEAHESMGLIKLREGDLTAAHKWYGEAVALHSSSFLAYYYFGTLSMRDGRNAEERAADSLREAIKLNPHFAPAEEALAQFDLMHSERLDEAVSANLQAVSLEPGNVDYRVTASEIRLARKEWTSAIAVLQSAAKIAQTSQDRERVQARLEQVQKYQKQTSHLEALRAEGAAEMAAAAKTPPPATREVRDTTGHVLRPEKLITPDHSFPDGPPSGPKHTVVGTLEGVGCFYPKGITLKVDGSAGPVALYSNDMYGISYTSGNFTPRDGINPCLEFEGLKAKVTYGSVQDPTMAGQILAMELNQ